MNGQGFTRPSALTILVKIESKESALQTGARANVDPKPSSAEATSTSRIERQRSKCPSSRPMPPWAAFAPRSSTLVSRSAIDRLPRAFRSCRNAARHPPFTHLRVRSASTHVAPAAINLRPNIPPQNRELHDAVSALSGAAETWVNISRVQLALSGLAAHDAVTRVAILGLNSQVSAQRLARLLLADPLGTEEKWEKELERASEGSERAVLLK